VKFTNQAKHNAILVIKLDLSNKNFVGREKCNSKVWPMPAQAMLE
jgi:hypothetical protein